MTCPRGELRPGDRVDCRASAPYRITTADARRGRVLNTAVAQATSPAGPGVTAPTKPSSPADTVTIPVKPGSRPTSDRPGTNRPGTSRPGTTGTPTVTRPGGRTPTTGRTPGAGDPACSTRRTCRWVCSEDPGAREDTRRKGKGMAIGQGPPIEPDHGDPFAPLPTVASEQRGSTSCTGSAAAAPAGREAGAQATPVTRRTGPGVAEGLALLTLGVLPLVMLGMGLRRRRRSL